MLYIVRCKDGQRWKVRQAVSLRAALNCIAHAKVTGSVGSSDMVTEYDNQLRAKSTRTLASVVQINSDGTERRPYTQAY